MSSQSIATSNAVVSSDNGHVSYPELPFTPVNVDEIQTGIANLRSVAAYIDDATHRDSNMLAEINHLRNERAQLAKDLELANEAKKNDDEEIKRLRRLVQELEKELKTFKNSPTSTSGHAPAATSTSLPPSPQVRHQALESAPAIASSTTPPSPPSAFFNLAPPNHRSSFPTTTTPAPSAPTAQASRLMLPPPLPIPSSSTVTPVTPTLRPRRLAREDAFCYRPYPPSEARPKRLRSENAFYHTSNGETYPWKAPNGGITPAPPVATAPSLPKRKRDDSDDDTESVATPSETCSNERQIKRRRSTDDDQDEGKPLRRSLRKTVSSRV